jgi:PAS domain S-box-containing protein/putative nucleotidyltransferase with HDIG domain
MHDTNKTKKELVQELQELRLQVSRLNSVKESEQIFRSPDYMSADLFKDLIENTNDLIHTITPDGRFLYANRSWLNTLGYDRTEIQKLRFTDIIHPDSRNQCTDFLNLLQSGDRVDMFQMELVKKAGGKLVVEVSAHAHYCEEKPLYVQCILRDITERRIAEEALRKMEELEASLLAAIPHAVVGLRERVIVFANEAAETVFGWKPGELLGQNTRIFYRSDEEYEEIGRHFYPILEKQQTHVEDFPCRHRDGRDLLCRISASVIGQKLEQKEIVVVYEDITERGQIEEALRESERKYADFYQNAPVGYHSLGSDGTFLEVNDTWLRMFGYSRDEVVGKMKLYELLTEEGKRIFDETFQQLKEQGSIENIQYLFTRKDGSLVPVLITASSIYDEQGNFLKTRSIVKDISARVSYRNKLEQALEEWRITFDSMPCGVFLLDLEFTILRTNKYIADLYECSFKELKQQKCFELIQSEILREIYFGLRSQSRVSIRPFEYYEESMKRHFMLSLTPIPDTSGITKAFVLTMIDITEIKDKQRKMVESKEAFFNMLKELDFSYRELRELYDGLIHSFVNAIDAKSPWTKGHSERVTCYAVKIGKAMGIDGEEIEILRKASLLHDIGKIGTYDVILDNPRKLTAEEYHLINLHPVKGEEILKPIKQLQALLPIIRHHHEQIDGSGYPDGLKGEAIPLFSRILCIADSFDSMTSDRPYRHARGKEYAISELKRCSGTQFDSAVVQTFLGVLERGEIFQNTP